jgi:hypothetical protein
MEKIQVGGLIMEAKQARNRRKKQKIGYNITAPSLPVTSKVMHISELYRKEAGLRYFRVDMHAYCYAVLPPQY